VRAKPGCKTCRPAQWQDGDGPVPTLRKGEDLLVGIARYCQDISAARRAMFDEDGHYVFAVAL